MASPRKESLGTSDSNAGALSQPPGATEVRGGVYVISVAARILDMHPQTLRKYERLGLVTPTRSMGMLRLYSAEDVVRVRLIKYMVDNLGMNLAGVEFAMSMVESLLALRQRLSAATEGTHLQQIAEQEVAALFRDMDLPLED